MCEGVETFGVAITDSGKLPCGCWELYPDPLKSNQCF